MLTRRRWFLFAGAALACLAAAGPALAVTVYDTFDTDPVPTAKVTFSGGNLTATCQSGPSLGASAIAQTLEGKTSGKWYVEFSCVAVSGGIDGVGLISSRGVGSSGFIGANTTSWAYYTNSHVVNNGSQQTSVNNVTWGVNDVIGVAIDLDNKRIWFNKNGGSYVGTSGTPNPATNTNGFDLTTAMAGSCRMYPGVNLSGVNASFTARFSASSLSGSAPSGFTAGWTNTTSGTYFGSFATSGVTGSIFTSMPPDNDKGVSPYTSSITGSVTSVVLSWVGSSGVSVKALIYDSTGVGGLPGALLGVSTNAPTPTGGETVFTFSGVRVVNGAKYWVGPALGTTSGGTAEMPPLTSGVAYNATNTFASPSNPFGASPSTLGNRFPALIFVTPDATAVCILADESSGPC